MIVKEPSQLYIIKSTKQVMSETSLAEIPNRKEQRYLTTFFKWAQPHVISGQPKLPGKNAKTEANDQSYDRQVMQKKAKTDLFEESENGNPRQVFNRYSKMNSLSHSKIPLVQNDEKITAFQDVMGINECQSIEVMKKKVDFSNKGKRLIALDKRSQVANQEVYWNKKRQQPTVFLRPAVLNPVIEIQLTKDQAKLLNSPLSKNQTLNVEKKKKFEHLIKNFARKTKDVFISSAQRSDQAKQKDKKVINLSKKLTRLRSKSTNIIQHQNRKLFLYNEIQKMAQKCEFDLQINCLNSIKEEIHSKKQEITKHNQDLKDKIRHLIIRQNKLADKKFSEVLLNGKRPNCDEQCLEGSGSDEQKQQKLRIIHDRSKSCIVTTFKGPENKKLKITNILGKIARYKNNQVDKKRGYISKCSQEGFQSHLQLIRCHTKIEQKASRQKNDQVLKLNQQFSQEEARRSLIKSIKTFCSNKNGTRLPFMSNMIKKIDHQ